MAAFPLPPYGSYRWRILMAWSRRQLNKIFRAQGVMGQITAHFHWSEFNTKDPWRSPMPTRAEKAARELCVVFLEPMRAKFGACYVTSGYRPRPYNADVGGVPNSQHIWDESPESVGADVKFARGTPGEWGAEARRIRRNHRGNRGGVGVYEKWVHVDTRQATANW